MLCSYSLLWQPEVSSSGLPEGLGVSPPGLQGVALPFGARGAAPASCPCLKGEWEEQGACISGLFVEVSKSHHVSCWLDLTWRHRAIGWPSLSSSFWGCVCRRRGRGRVAEGSGQPPHRAPWAVHAVTWHATCHSHSPLLDCELLSQPLTLRSSPVWR